MMKNSIIKNIKLISDSKSVLCFGEFPSIDTGCGAPIRVFSRSGLIKDLVKCRKDILRFSNNSRFYFLNKYVFPEIDPYTKNKSGVRLKVSLNRTVKEWFSKYDRDCSSSTLDNLVNEVNSDSAWREKLVDMKNGYSENHKLNLHPDRFGYMVTKLISNVFPTGSQIPILKPCYDFDEIWSYVNKSAGSGWGLKGKKSEHVDEVKQFLADLKAERVSHKEVIFPNLIFGIIQPGKSGKLKRRTILSPQLMFTITEMVFGLRFMEIFSKEKNSDIRYGDRMITTYNLIKDIQNKYKIAVDFSSYDQSIPTEIIVTCFTLQRRLMDLTPYEDKLYWEMVSSICHSPLYHDDIGVVHRNRGIISGSYYTNVVDSMSNLLVMNYADFHKRTLSRTIVYGDDNVLIGDDSYPDIVTIKHELKKIGMVITYDWKERSSSFKIEFAGSLWDKDGPVRNKMRMILGTCIQRSRWPRFHSKRDLLKSRIFTVFQADKRVFSLMTSLKLPIKVGEKIFQFGISVQRARGLDALLPQVEGFIKVPRNPWMRL